MKTFQRKLVSPHTKPDTAIAACVAELGVNGGKAADAIQLFPAGEFRAADGRPQGLAGWFIDARVAELVIERAARRTTPFVIDYEHQTLNTEINGQPAPAAGWFSTLVWRDSGLYATGVQWTPKASQMIADGEYRFISPVFLFDPQTGEVLELLMAAITNNPAIDGMAEVAAAAKYKFHSTKRPEATAVDEKLLALLGLKEGFTEEQADAAIGALTAKLAGVDALQTQVAALKNQTAADPAKYVPVEAVAALQTQLAQLTAKVQQRDVEALLESGLKDGRILPPMTDWARNLGNQDVAALTAYLQNAAPIAALCGSQSGGKGPTDKPGQLTETDIAACTLLGISQADFLKTKQSKETQ